jgi:polysaccharide export outer membrane protein
MHRPSVWIFGLLLLASSAIARSQVRLDTTATGSVSQPNDTAGVTPPAGPLSTTLTGARAVLGAGDLVEVGVFDTPEMTQRVRVNGDGVVHLALIGDIVVKGISTDALRDRIAQQLVAGRFVKDPQVTVFVIEYAGQMVYVTGEVNRPGAYSLLRSYRLQDLISVAGGLTQRAGNMVTIVRESDPKNPIQINLSDKNQADSNPEISPGDSISVGLTGIVYVLGNVARPGGFLIDRRTTMNFMEALSLAEGPTQTASLTTAFIIHSTQPNPQAFPVNIKKILKSESPDPQLEAGDIIWVGDSQTRNFGRLAISTILGTASGVAIYAAYPH